MISSLLIGLVMVASMNSLGSVVRGRMENGYQVRGMHLAQQLMTEILLNPYKDSGLATFGVELGENPNDRTTFDDVDDYHGWSSSPPEDIDGIEIENTAGWQRSVWVNWANPNQPANTVIYSSGVKRITVTVSFEGSTVATLSELCVETFDE